MPHKLRTFKYFEYADYIRQGLTTWEILRTTLKEFSTKSRRFSRNFRRIVIVQELLGHLFIQLLSPLYIRPNKYVNVLNKLNCLKKVRKKIQKKKKYSRNFNSQFTTSSSLYDMALVWSCFFRLCCVWSVRLPPSRHHDGCMRICVNSCIYMILLPKFI